MGKTLVYPKGISNTANRYAKRGKLSFDSWIENDALMFYVQ